jgi:hypothetical protein
MGQCDRQGLRARRIAMLSVEGGQGRKDRSTNVIGRGLVHPQGETRCGWLIVVGHTAHDAPAANDRNGSKAIMTGMGGKRTLR